MSNGLTNDEANSIGNFIEKMKNIPLTIFLQIEESEIENNDFKSLDIEYVMWCSDKINDLDIEYINKEAYRQQLKEAIDKYYSGFELQPEHHNTILKIKQIIDII